MHAWQIAITAFLVLSFVSFASAAYAGVLMLKTAESRVIAAGLGIGTNPGLSSRLNR